MLIITVSINIVKKFDSNNKVYHVDNMNNELLRFFIPLILEQKAK